MQGRDTQSNRRLSLVSLRNAAALGLCTFALLLMSGCGGGESDNTGSGTAEGTAPGEREIARTVPEEPTPVPPAPKPTGPLPPEAGCVTAECHATLATARQIHGAVSTGDCTVCHEQDSGGHIYPLKRQGEETCTFCHAVSGTRMHQHAAMEVGECTICHDPHVSDVKFLLTAESVQAVCEQCHYTDKLAHGHEPYLAGECTTCHEPHESNFSRLLRGGEGPAHCYMCHVETEQAITNASHVHEPTADCISCHSPHASDYLHSLHRPADETCFSCHEDLKEQVVTATTPHAAVFTGERCANCHDAHAADRPMLLRNRQDTLCLQCHDRPIKTVTGWTIPDMAPILRDRKYLHGPIRAGNCDACHAVHGATHSRLLRAHFTEAFYETSFDLGSYALCFSCHADELVLTERTTTITGFRDGERNLHYLHVHRDRKGRTCRTCHDVHGSNLPRHLAEKIPFEGSQWMMSLNFEMMDDGGSCTPGCHQQMAYHRSGETAPSNAPSGGAR